MDYEKAYKEAHSRAEMFRNTIYKGVAEEILDWPGRSDVVDWIERQKPTVVRL